MQLYEFQKQNIQKLTKPILLADEMGLGKTCQILASLTNLNTSPVLIVCPKSVVSVWVDEAAKWLSQDYELFIYQGPSNKRTTVYTKFKESLKLSNNSKLLIFITTWELTRKDMNLLSGLPWKVIVVDEAHRMKNRKTKQSISVRSLSRKIPYRFALTGTPIINRPDELWAILNFLYPAQFTSYWRFFNQFVDATPNPWGGYFIKGIKNKRELDYLLAPIVLRHTKQEVLKELPDKIYQNIQLDFTTKQTEMYNSMVQYLKAKLSDGTYLHAPIILAQLIRLKQICNSPKLLDYNIQDDGCKIEWLLDFVQDLNSNQLVIYTQFSKMADLIYEKLKNLDIRAELFTGSQNSKQREQILKDFEQKKIQIVILTYGAGGLGLNLAFCSTAILIDKPWSPALIKQAEDRLHRIGQKNSVHIICPIIPGTIETKIEKLLSWKEDISNLIISNKNYLIEEVLSEYNQL